MSAMKVIQSPDEEPRSETVEVRVACSVCQRRFSEVVVDWEAPQAIARMRKDFRRHALSDHPGMTVEWS